ncbi:transposase [Mesorhizobium shangrilense]|uniref:Transposase n=1 Tax=Mesorhizobium shangrilense TaxID=460060 RepID=A0ABV2DSU4_9HYPH
MHRAAFNVYVETQLAPTLQPGDVVILDNLSVRTTARAEAAIRACGVWMLFLPQYLPDLNPIEMAVSKLKAHLHKAAARTFDALFMALHGIAISSSQTSAETTSKQQDMLHSFGTMR